MSHQAVPVDSTNQTIYKWTILRHVDGVYAVTEYALIDGVWEPCGDTFRWTYIDGVLEHIRTRERQIKSNI